MAKPDKPKGGDKPGRKNDGPKQPVKDPSKGKGQGDGPKQDKISRDQIEEDYGLSYALFKAFPELNDLLKKAIAQNWTPTKFQVELRQTKWFEKHSDVWREVTALQYSDPATFNDRVQESLTAVTNLAGSVGSQIGPEGLQRLAKRALLMGWDEAQIRDVLAKTVRPSGAGYYTGDLADVEDTLRSTALQNGITLHDDQLQKWMQGIVRGNASQEQFVTAIRRMAADAFPLYGEQVKSGLDLMDVASPFIQSMSELLELNPADIKLTDPTIRRALSGTPGSNGQVGPTTLSSFEDGLRNDPRWLYTKNARKTAEDFGASIAKMWGLV
jgi:hypothetical protein